MGKETSKCPKTTTSVGSNPVENFYRKDQKKLDEYNKKKAEEDANDNQYLANLGRPTLSRGNNVGNDKGIKIEKPPSVRTFGRNSYKRGGSRRRRNKRGRKTRRYRKK